MAIFKPTAQASASAGNAFAAILPNDPRPWYKRPHLLKLNFIILSLVLFSSANGYDGTMMNGLQALPLWQEFMSHPTGAWLGFINAAQAVGAIVAAFPVAWIVQKYGRKIGIYFGYLWLVIAVILQTAAPNVGCFITARFFLGLTSTFWGNASPLLITETAFPTQRGVATSLYMCGWYIGSLIAAWATFATRNYDLSWSWRVPSVLQVVIPIFCLPGVLMAPESPRWLVSQDRLDEARQFLVEYHNGGVHDAFTDFELDEIVTTLKMEKEASTSTSWADMFRTKGNRHRSLISITLGIFAQWNGVGVVSYYFVLVLQTAGITDLTQQTLLNGCIQIWNLILATGGAFSVDRLGRRKLFLISGFGMLVSYICITGLSGSFAETGKSQVGIAVIPFLFLFYGFYDIAMTPLLIAYPAEIWPYTLRSKGIAMTALSTQLAVFFNIFVNPIALDSIGWKYYIVFVVVLVIAIATSWLVYPETKGHSLEEMAIIFDGEDAAVGVSAQTVDRVLQEKGTVIDTVHIEKV